jgi:hypothetical protein
VTHSLTRAWCISALITTTVFTMAFYTTIFIVNIAL